MVSDKDIPDNAARLISEMRSKAQVKTFEPDCGPTTAKAKKLLKQKIVKDCQEDEIVNASSTDHERAVSVRNAMDSVSEKSKALADKMRDRSRKRNSGEEAAIRREAKRAKLEELKKDQAPTSKNIKKYWADQMKLYFPLNKDLGWELDIVKIKQCNTLINNYDIQLIERAIDYIFDNWNVLKTTNYKFKNLGDVPDFDAMYRSRVEIMSNLQINPETRDADNVPDKKIF